MEPFFHSVTLVIKANKGKFALIVDLVLVLDLFLLPLLPLCLFFSIFSKKYSHFSSSYCDLIEDRSFYSQQKNVFFLPPIRDKINNFIKKKVAYKRSTKSKINELFLFKNKDIYFNSKFLSKFLLYITAKNIHGDFGLVTVSKFGE